MVTPLVDCKDFTLTSPLFTVMPLSVSLRDAVITPADMETPLIVPAVAAVITPVEDIVATDPTIRDPDVKERETAVTAPLLMEIPLRVFEEAAVITPPLMESPLSVLAVPAVITPVAEIVAPLAICRPPVLVERETAVTAPLLTVTPLSVFAVAADMVPRAVIAPPVAKWQRELVIGVGKWVAL